MYMTLYYALEKRLLAAIESAGPYAYFCAIRLFKVYYVKAYERNVAARRLEIAVCVSAAASINAARNMHMLAI